MAQNAGTDFHISDEILSVIPTDPYDQLDLARKITSMAIASRVSQLELEADRLRQKINDQDRTIFDLEQQIAELDRMYQDLQARFQIAIEENVKLTKERDVLVFTSKKLGKDLTKLEAFKRQLMQSLSDDNSFPQIESVDIEACDQSTLVRTSSRKDEASISRRGSDVSSVSTEIEDQIQDESVLSLPKISITPYVTPVGTPTVGSTDASPRGFSTAKSSPRFWSSSPSTKARFEGHSSLSFTSTSSQQSSSMSSSPTQGHSVAGRTLRIDGKEFFRQARCRLSYEQFGALLANIKELNAQRQTREETIEKAEEIFGLDNKDLYISFQRLLNRNLTYYF